MSGRYPLHTGCHTIISSYQTQGLPLDEETLPQVLRKSGYQAHAVGKWHLGHSRWEQTPTFRGFQSFYGYYLGWSDYYTHYIGINRSDYGYDFHNDFREFCGENCSSSVDERGNYSTNVFTRKAIEIIQGHDPEKPLFLYLAHQAVHAPDEVPREYLDLYRNQTSWSNRRKAYAGMLTAADESIATVTKALRERAMWNNTLVVFTTDNGGPTAVCAIQGSSNKPKRGGKCTVWEGGTTGDAFVSGPALKTRLGATSTGTNYTHLFHVVDWLPTLAAIASAKPDGKPLDGVNHLDPLVQGSNASKPPREELFIGYAEYSGNWYGPAVRWKNWKLLQGTSGGPEEAGAKPPAPHRPARGGDADAPYLLFDIDEDPSELVDLSDQYPLIVEIMQAKLRTYQQTYVPPIEPGPDCGPFGGIKNTSKYGPTWGPWCSQLVVYQ